MKNLLVLLIAIVYSSISWSATISGKVFYQGDSTRPITNVNVVLKNVQNNSVATYLTGPDGYYEFLNVPAGTYTLKGMTQQQPGGVTMQDANLVKAYLKGKVEFNDIQKLAADVDGDGLITDEDYELIKNHVTHNTPFPVGEWVFLSETITVSNLKDSNPGGVVGSSSGDVGGVFVPGIRELGVYPVDCTGSLLVTKGEQFNISIKTSEALLISAAGLIIHFSANLITVRSVDFSAAGLEYTIEDGLVQVSWIETNGSAVFFNEGTDLLTLHCTAGSGLAEGMEARFTLDGNSSLAGKDYSEITGARFRMPMVECVKPELKISNFPNPFTTATTLSYFLPEDGPVSVVLFNQVGKMVKEFTPGDQTQGYHNLELDGAGLPPGYYYCRISHAGSTESIRILKTK